MRQKPKRLIQFLGNFPLGLLIGAVIAFSLSIAIDSYVAEAAQKNFTYLFTFLGSLIASGIAIAGILANIGNQQLVEEKCRIENLRASRAVLPLALTRIIEVCEAGLEIAYKEEKALRDAANHSQFSLGLMLDPEVLKILQDCIRYSDENSSSWLTLLVSRYQVYRSRTISFAVDQNRLITDRTRAQVAIDWVVQKAITEHVFDFARGAELIPETLDPKLIRFPIHLLHLPNPNNEALKEQVDFASLQFSPYSVAKFELTG